MKTSTFSILTVLIISLSFSTQAQDLQWANQLGGGTMDEARSIAIDDAGNVYSTGKFGATADFDPGAGVYNLTAAGGSLGGYEIFVSKLDSSGNFVWAKQMGGTDGETGRAITLDDSANVIIAGQFAATSDFDPGPDTFNLTVTGYIDLFISKLDSSGNFIWAKQIGSNGFDVATSVVTDASGNVYVAGYFDQTADFDPNAGTFNLTSAGGSDIFILKLDAAGNFVWVKQIGGSSIDECLSLAIDGSGNLCTSGSFSGTVDFDSGAGTFNLVSSASSAMFILKLDTTGNFVWAKTIGSNSFDKANSIATDAFGNVYTTGSFRANAFGANSDFDPGVDTFNLTPVGDDDIFISKLDANGNFVWAKQIGGTLDDEATCISLDASGNVYTTGGFISTVDFDPNSGISNLTASSIDVFILTLDTAGNFVWAKQIGGSSACLGYSIAIDAPGNIYTAGSFAGTADFDPVSGPLNLTTAGGNDIFITKHGAGTFTGISEALLKNDIIIYPNPTTDFITVRNSSDKIITATIFEISGRMIYTMNILSGETTIPMKEFSKGVYIMYLNDGKNASRMKIIKE